MASEEETLYCSCRQPYDETKFMIECDVCKEWFHGSCVGVQEHQASDIEIYHCPSCQMMNGPLVLKKRRNWHRHDYSEDDPNKQNVQTGTVVFIKELKNRMFPCADEIPLLRLHGFELTSDFVDKHGFDTPVLVEKKDGLGLSLPPSNFSIQDVEFYVGSMREIDVIDVSRQEDYKMLMREWTEYYNSPNRTKIFNVISLEFSNTRLSELVVPPSVIRELSWANNIWPDQLPEDCPYSKPEVQKYCLMGVKDSFTDFHIDFGGTSVWYHVLRGEKVFYLIRPTPANMALYENWISSSNQSETFFGDQVDRCYKCVVKQGQTFFIPTGWIHAVFTPIDSLVFGGNFLHSYNIALQLKVYDIERRVKTPEKYLFPSFETICWYAAKHILDLLKDHLEDGKKPRPYLLEGGKAIAASLKSWTQRKDLNSQTLFLKTAKHEMPEHIQYGKLLKELNKVTKEIDALHNKSPAKKPERKRKKKVNPSAKELAKLDVLHQHTQVKLQELQEEHASVTSKKKSPASSLRMRIPKAGAYLDSTLKTDPGDPYALPDDPYALPDDDENQNNNNQESCLKLKVSNGKIISQDKTKPIYSPPGAFQPLIESEKPKVDVKDTKKAKVKKKAEKPSAVPKIEINEVKEKEDMDSDNDNLVVDENPKLRQSREKTSSSLKKPGSLKLKLSFHGKPIGTSGGDPETGSKVAGEDSALLSPEAPPSEQVARLSMPTIRGGLNGSIADILEASGYGTETDFKVDDEIGRGQSPSMRDAIQGMLSMSRMNAEGDSLFKDDGKRSEMIAREEEKMQSYYKDDEFVYPSFEMSDDEDDRNLKPRGKSSRDETWNPKARVHMLPTPKRDCPAREGARRESVESGLAAAAAKLATAPKPKRQYVRKKPKPEKLPISSLAIPDAVHQPQPGTSTNSGVLNFEGSGDPSQQGLKRPAGTLLESPNKAKKPKKGHATAKQRLGKILKIHKMMF
ncbi:histone lysine demethylase PHF8-like isoform X2 [Liolophura sinensis]|uniref:histone lysine demethylase PHF8-like isoform X2 n=1 Tax=Liolophura sinensis TaxID=3198878 RepID=UPI0031581067